jgi:large subunit ribosomal protein L3
MNQNPGVYGRKLGNTQFFSPDGSVVRVTVIEAGPCVVIDKRTPERDGYSALVIGLGERKEKHTNKAQLAVAKKINGTPKRTIKEIRVPADVVAKYEIGATLKLDEVFQVGERVDTQGLTRGRGFTGVMRLWGFAGSCRSHGAHEYQRHGGSIGTNMTPGRTFPNHRMAGQYGNQTVSMLNLRVARIDAEKHLIMIEGGVPGAKGSLVLVRKAVKTPAKKK